MPSEDGEADQLAAFRAAREAAARWTAVGDVHPAVAARLIAEGVRSVVDLGCGDGALARALPPEIACVGVDRLRPLLRAAGPLVVGADMAALPLRAMSADAAVALWSLYFTADPATVLHEVRRTVRPGGWFAACTTARDDGPELRPYFAEPRPTPFDAEEATAIVAAALDVVDVERWDAPLVRLPDAEAVTTYLIGRGANRSDAEAVAGDVDLPFTVTKRGVLVWARVPG